MPRLLPESVPRLFSRANSSHTIQLHAFQSASGNSFKAPPPSTPVSAVSDARSRKVLPTICNRSKFQSPKEGSGYRLCGC